MEPLTTTIASVAATAVLKNFFDKSLPAISSATGLSAVKLRSQINKYLQNAFETHTTVRLLSNKTEDVFVKDVYVNSFLRKIGSDESISDDELLEHLLNGNRVAVRGSGGSGKTLLMKYLWLQILMHKDNYIPLFVNLRRINTLSGSRSIHLTPILKLALTSNETMADSDFAKLCSNGKVVIILDGFDELNHEYRDKVENEITEFSVRYPGCSIIITSRDNDAIRRISHFDLYDINGFTLEQARTLVKKSHVDDVVIENFTKLFDEEFFQRYQTFLKIPLMVLMMVITFRSSASLPQEPHKFYENVFTALFDDHDASKGGWRRQRNLGFLEAKRLLAIFCIRTYLSGQYEFSRSEFEKAITDSIHIANKSTYQVTKVKAPTDKVISDISESLCLIVEDDGTYYFVHRSFQEYFAAYFISSMEAIKTQDLMYAVSQRNGDQVLALCYSMNPDLVIQNYILPTYEVIRTTPHLSSIQLLSEIADREDISRASITLLLMDRLFIESYQKRIHPDKDVNFVSSLSDEDKNKLGIFETPHTGGLWKTFAYNLNSFGLIKFSSFSKERRRIEVPNFRHSLVNFSEELADKFLVIFETNGFREFDFSVDESGVVSAHVTKFVKGELVPTFLDLEDVAKDLGDDILSILENALISFVNTEINGRKYLSRKLSQMKKDSDRIAEASIEGLFDLE